MSPRTRLSVSGHYAGPVSRAATALVDGGLITVTYTLGYGADGVEGDGLVVDHLCRPDRATCLVDQAEPVMTVADVDTRPHFRAVQPDGTLGGLGDRARAF